MTTKETPKEALVYNFPHAIDTVFKEITSEEYVNDRAKWNIVDEVTADIKPDANGGVVMDLDRYIVRDYPKALKHLLPAKTHMTHVETWERDGTGWKGTYDVDVLASFDFIVASIHSQLSMDINKATSRLLTAIANPYTTMLGHPTGRLLLKREGYPIDHKAVIDACAEHNVIIEINAHPFRLDLDWRWVHYAIEKDVMLSINPDAHSMTQYELMKYGVLVGRKGGLTRKHTFNSLSREEVDKYFRNRKEKISK